MGCEQKAVPPHCKMPSTEREQQGKKLQKLPTAQESSTPDGPMNNDAEGST
jgi:hypothetical protein